MFTQTKFLGATVTGFATNSNWNEQGSTCTVYIVEDENVGDDFLLKAGNVQNYQGNMMWTPAHFELGSFQFDGLIAAFQQTDGFEGHPTFDITLVNPIAILEGTQVICSNYVGPVNDSIFNGTSSTATFKLSNVLNAFGYLEKGGANFGGSLVNADGNSYSDTGLFWEGPAGLKTVIQTLTTLSPSTNDQTNWGSYLSFGGHYYSVDLSAIPIAPAFYRVGNCINLSLIELISTVCSDAGVYFIAKLEIREGNGPHRIYFQIADLVGLDDLNAIATFIAGQDNIESSNVGMEVRTTDYTQAMIFGGDISTLTPIENSSTNDPVIIPFWGFDINGQVITGRKPNGTFFADDDHQMILNASEIADIMGSIGQQPFYPSTVLEMRCALAGYDSWAAYLVARNPDFANYLGIGGAVNTDFALLGGDFITDYVDESVKTAKQLGSMNKDDKWTTVSQRVFYFVNGQADRYYGKQFLVKFPFTLQVKNLPDSNTVLYSDDPSDAGYYTEGSSPLGLNFVNEKFFMSNDGRFYPFLRYQFNTQFGSVSALAEGTTTTVSADSSNIENNAVVQYDNNVSKTAIYNRYQVETRNVSVTQDNDLTAGPIVFVKNTGGLAVPAFVVSVGEPVWAQAPDPLGGIPDIAQLLGAPVDSVYLAAQIRADSFPMSIHPPAFYPNGVAIALKSNQYVYGPWGRWVSDGRCQILDRDDQLTPWDCGGYSIMNQVAMAKIQNVALPKKVKERGGFSQAGMPTASVGDVLIEGGPTISNISVNISVDGGIKTSYAMETYVPRVGVFIRENADRMKRYGRLGIQMRRSIRTLLLEKKAQVNIAMRSKLGFMMGTSYAVRQKTPHAVLGGQLIFDSGSNGYRPLIYTETYRESVANVCANDDDLYQRSAAIGLDGVFRPFSTNLNPPSGSLLSSYQPLKDLFKDNAFTREDITPFQDGCDMVWVSHGDEYVGLNGVKNKPDYDNLRGMSIRGPAIISAWGYDVFGKPFPNAGGSGIDPLSKYTDEFPDEYLANSQTWPAGPINLRFNPLTGSYDFPSIFLGVASGDLEGGTTGPVELYIDEDTPTGEIVQVSNFFRTGLIPSSGRLMMALNPLNNKLYVLAGECGS